MDEGIPTEFWDNRFSSDEFAYGDRASRLLMAWNDVLQQASTALVPACGEGRDAVYLAQQGLEVTAVDMSRAGLEKTRQLALERGVEVDTIHADLRSWNWPMAKFDIVAGMFMHIPSEVRKGLHEKMVACLSLGGHAFIEGFSTEQIAFQQRYTSGGPPDEDMLYTLDGLRDDFSNLQPFALWAGVETLAEGRYHTGPASLIRTVFQKQEHTNG